MARINSKVRRSVLRTHEGAPARRIPVELQLRRSVMASMLWERQYYESGAHIADRIKSLVPKVDPLGCYRIALEARHLMNLRHVPLLVAREMARNDRHKHMVSALLPQIIQRADELCEFMAIYNMEAGQKMSAQVKKGLASAFEKFDAYQLAKYDREGAWRLRDVMFMCHPKPVSDEQARVWKQLIDGSLAPPDTWEVRLSGGENPNEVFTDLLKRRKLGALALIRNLRNFEKYGVHPEVVRAAMADAKVDRILPFRFIAAAHAAPGYEAEVEDMMFRCCANKPKLPGLTVLLVDVSGSMDWPLSGRSKMRRLEAATALAAVAREQCEKVAILSFSNHLEDIPANRRGIALAETIVGSQLHQGTYLGAAVNAVYETGQVEVGYRDYVSRGWNPDRLIVITDEQSHDTVPGPKGRGYMINVASYRNGVGYGEWVHIDGFSGATLDYVHEYEKAFDK